MKKREKKNESELRAVCRSLRWTFIFIQIELPKKTCACRMNWYFRLFVAQLFSVYFVLFFFLRLFVKCESIQRNTRAKHIHIYVCVNDIFGDCCWQQPAPTTNVVYQIRLHENCSHILKRMKWLRDAQHEQKKTKKTKSTYTPEERKKSIAFFYQFQVAIVAPFLFCYCVSEFWVSIYTKYKRFQHWLEWTLGSVGIRRSSNNGSRKKRITEMNFTKYNLITIALLFMESEHVRIIFSLWLCSLILAVVVVSLFLRNKTRVCVWMHKNFPNRSFILREWVFWFFCFLSAQHIHFIVEQWQTTSDQNLKYGYNAYILCSAYVFSTWYHSCEAQKYKWHGIMFTKWN